MSDNLAAYLLARLDEDEQEARTTRPHGLKPAVWGVEPWYDGTEERCDLRDYPLGDLTSRGGLEVSTAAHIARWDPARVLAEVEVKRRIVDLHTGSHECSTYDHNGDIDNCTWVIDGDCSTIRLLAQPYADRDDFNPEWSL